MANGSEEQRERRREQHAAETALALFGFDRKLLGDGASRITDWRKEFRKEREQSIQLEGDLDR